MGNCFEGCCACCGCACCSKYDNCCSCFVCKCCVAGLYLPQADPEPQKRLKNIARDRAMYTLTATTGQLPVLSGLAAIVSELSAQQLKNTTVIYARLKEWDVQGAILAAIEMCKNGDKLTLDSYKALFMHPPKIADEWRTDKSFGYLRIAGVNPTRIFQVNIKNAAAKLAKDRFPVTDEVLAGLLPTGVTIQSLVANGRLYMTESPETEGLELSGGKFVTSPICLFWVDDSDDVMPLAIQLYPLSEKRPAETNIIYTPNDKPGLWLAAKLHAAYADMMTHSVNSHVYSMHTTMECIWVVMCRTLAPAHPLRAFFDPHMYQMLIVNKGIRGTLQPGGDLEKLFGIKEEGINKLTAYAFRTWSLQDINCENQFDSRDVNDLPKYYFRDDMRAYNKVLKTYAEKMVALMYPTQNDLVRDNELQQFYSECEGVGFKGLPPRDSVAGLAELVSHILLNVTVRHSYVETSGFALYAYAPASPLSFTLPPEAMRRDRDFTERDLQANMATMYEAADQIALIRSIDMRVDPNYYLGWYDCKFMKGLEGASVAVNVFIAELQIVGSEIERRNAAIKAKGGVPFEYFNLWDLYSSTWN